MLDTAISLWVLRGGHKAVNVVTCAEHIEETWDKFWYSVIDEALKFTKAIDSLYYNKEEHV